MRCMPETVTCRLCGRGFAPCGCGCCRHAYCKRCTAKADRTVAKEAAKARRVRCKECGKAFSPMNSRALLCSDACRRVANRRYWREYKRRKLADPQYRAVANARVRAQYARRRDAEGKESERRQGGRPRRGAAGRGAGRASNGAPPRAAVCRLCSGSFEYSARARRVYCDRCTAKADREAARTAVKARRVRCKVCGKAFSTRLPHVEMCSDACRLEASRRQNREYKRRKLADPQYRAVANARARASRAARRDGKKRTAAGGGIPHARASAAAAS